MNKLNSDSENIKKMRIKNTDDLDNAESIPSFSATEVDIDEVPVVMPPASIRKSTSAQSTKPDPSITADDKASALNKTKATSVAQQPIKKIPPETTSPETAPTEATPAQEPLVQSPKTQQKEMLQSIAEASHVIHDSPTQNKAGQTRTEQSKMEQKMTSSRSETLQNTQLKQSQLRNAEPENNVSAPAKPVSKKLRECPVCNGKVSRNAAACPHCGEPDPFNIIMATNWTVKLFWTAVIIGGVYLCYTEVLPMIKELPVVQQILSEFE